MEVRESMNPVNLGPVIWKSLLKSPYLVLCELRLLASLETPGLSFGITPESRQHYFSRRIRAIPERG